jgi:demethylmenaquinone methyltransferase/2-methoxy-6-polyprenyl-1,4-benzoquinol methylase
VETDLLLDEQRRYYRERAPEYDDWWFRRGRYGLDDEGNARWAAECAEVEEALARADLTGAVLELACGTGLWTRHLAPRAGAVTAVDASAEMLALNRARVADDSVEYVQADLFAWRPSQAYDACVFAFWLSHVPEERFDEFWALVRRALVPRGLVFFVDSGRGDGAHARRASTGVELRRLRDGRGFRIVKHYHAPSALQRRLHGLGFELDVRSTQGGAFVYGTGARG